MIDLTEEQMQALAVEGERPPQVRNPRTRETYVLVRRDVYDWVREHISEVNERADWNDPAFDVYDRDQP